MKKPSFVEGTHREWKAKKRSEFDAVIRAYDKFQLGCAFIPGYVEHRKRISADLASWREKMSVRNWGR